jgi:hypothetical protein
MNHRQTTSTLHAVATSLGPEGRWKFAGGASHRAEWQQKSVPEGTADTCVCDISSAPSGRVYSSS